MKQPNGYMREFRATLLSIALIVLIELAGDCRVAICEWRGGEFGQKHWYSIPACMIRGAQ
jgi:hypothetical protein